MTARGMGQMKAGDLGVKGVVPDRYGVDYELKWIMSGYQITEYYNRVNTL